MRLRLDHALPQSRGGGFREDVWVSPKGKVRSERPRHPRRTPAIGNLQPRAPRFAAAPDGRNIAMMH